MGIVRNCAHMNSFILRIGLWSRSKLWFVFLWNPSVKPLSVKTPSCSMHSVGTSFVNNTLLFLLNTLVLTSENMLCKSSLSPLGELVEALGVQQMEQISWSLWCLGCRKCTLTCIFLIWTEEVQLPYVWSFRSKILRFRQNSLDLLRNCAGEYI